jgi:sodium transport system ATP-binding protein
LTQPVTSPRLAAHRILPAVRPGARLIQVQELRKVFHDRKKGEIPAVRGVSFSCSPGRVFGLLGRNGAGKTTTLRMLATILAPTSGTAEVAGFDIVRQGADVRRSIGYLSGDTKLYNRLTGREILGYFGALAGMDSAAVTKRLSELRDVFDLEEVLGKRVSSMSTGMKQRLSIARVVLHDPPVLIFDEPTAGLDVIGARDVLSIIRDFRGRGRTVIFSTHIMTEVEKVCDEVAIIEQGLILAQGTVADLRRRVEGGTLEDAFVQVVEGATHGQ